MLQDFGLIFYERTGAGGIKIEETCGFESSAKEIKHLCLVFVECLLADHGAIQLPIGYVVGDAVNRPTVRGEVGRPGKDASEGAVASAVDSQRRLYQSVAGIVDHSPCLAVAHERTVIAILWLRILESPVHHDVGRPRSATAKDPMFRSDDLVKAAV